MGIWGSSGTTTASGGWVSGNQVIWVAKDNFNGDIPSNPPGTATSLRNGYFVGMVENTTKSGVVADIEKGIPSKQLGKFIIKYL